MLHGCCMSRVESTRLWCHAVDTGVDTLPSTTARHAPAPQPPAAAPHMSCMPQLRVHKPVARTCFAYPRTAAKGCKLLGGVAEEWRGPRLVGTWNASSRQGSSHAKDQLWAWPQRYHVYNSTVTTPSCLTMARPRASMMHVFRQLAVAIAEENYTLAAKLRDEQTVGDGQIKGCRLCMLHR